MLNHIIPLSLVLPFSRKGGGCILKDPPRLRMGEDFSLSVGSWIMVALEPVLTDALPYLSNSGIIHELFELFVTELKLLDRN